MRFSTTFSTILAAALALGNSLSAAPVHPTLPFTGLTVVDEIDCSQAPAADHHFAEFPAGVTQIQTILGSPARTMDNPVGGTHRYFSYRIGKGKGLQAGKAYILEVEYPEDAPRAMVIMNQGEAGARGLHTEQTLGDALRPPYVNSNSESLDIPRANTWKTWRSLFHLHDRFMDMTRAKENNVIRPLVPIDGFNVIVVHHWNEDEPLSVGAAVRKIRLLEAPPLATYDAGLRLPPAGLPRRHIFSREEMYDGVAGLGSSVLENRGVTTSINYYEYRARLMRFLGINTYTKDLLEFGSNQGFDSLPGGGNSWYFWPSEPNLWEEILTMAASHGFDVLPYYEYAGSQGADGLGNERRAKPLSPNLTSYTNISWGDGTRADLSDPDTHADAKKLLDVTMTRFRDKVNFPGAWFRNRVSQMPFSFNNNNIAQFSREVLGRPITRAQLQTTTGVYNQYLEWFLLKRRDFILEMRDHLRLQGVNEDAILLYTSDVSESGRSYQGSTELISEVATNWNSVGVTSVPMSTAVSTEWHWKALTRLAKTWGGWEWQHADPYNDPSNYAGTEGAMLTYTFNKAYTLANPAWTDAFRTQSGLAMVKHFSLNERTVNSPPPPSEGGTYTGPLYKDPLGYFVTDFERTGPFCMMGEAVALAKADPFYVGYLSATTVNRGFPEYVRAFNRAFLALPAVPSVVRAGASSNSNVTVRDYATDGFGMYLAVINTARTDQNSVVVTLPFQADVTDATTGASLGSMLTSVTFDLYPFQVKALHLKKHTATSPIAVNDTATVNEGASVDINVVSNDTGPGTKTVSAVGTPGHGSVSIVSNQVRYVPAPGFFGSDHFRYTVSNGSDTDMARVTVTVNNQQAAGDLTDWGLEGGNIGAEDGGRSRLLSGGIVGEVTGFGAGTQGNADMGSFAFRVVTGDFQAVIKVNSVSGTAADAMGGLMVRQSEAAGACMVAALVDPAGALHVRSRNVQTVEPATPAMDASGGEVSSSGNDWLRLTRAGNRITVERSIDNVSYTEVAWRDLPGLPATVQLGLWVAGGNRYAETRALMQGFSVSNTTTDALFIQDFSSSSSVASYVDAGGAANTWANISGEGSLPAPTGGVWDIDPEGALRLTTTLDTSVNNDAGFTRTAALPLAPGVLKTSVRFGVSGIGDSFKTFSFLEWGTYSTVIDYGASNATTDANTYAQVGIQGNDTGKFRIAIHGTTGGEYEADGRLHRMTVFLSTSSSDQNYIGPDGLSHALNAGTLSVWIDDAPAIENAVRKSTYTASAPACFKFRSTGGDGLVYRFDDFLLENRFEASTPSRTNVSPIASNDSGFTTPEGVPIVLTVLANDTDADRGPDGLRLTNAACASGMTAIVGEQILFTPAPGFTGLATINYSVSDGLAAANATAQVTVTSTATAGNLAGAGMNGSAVGSGVTGGSRVLSDGYWEVRQSGGSGTPASDKLWWERKSVTGDFQVEARIREMQAVSAGGIGGLMIRETNAAGSRMVRISLDPAAGTTTAKAAHRLSVNGNATEGGTTHQLVYPAAWLQLERRGSIITARVSSDGVAFTELETVQLSGLATTVETGLWATDARMAATGFIIRPYQSEVLKMDFESSINYLDYVQELDPEPNQVSDIGAEQFGGTWSIDSGRLKIVRTADTSADSGAGILRNTPFPGPPAALRISFDLTLANVNVGNDIIVLEFGNFTGLKDYNNAIVSAPINCRLNIRGRGAGKYAFWVSGVTSQDYLTSAGTIRVSFWVNNSGALVNYQSPDGVTRSLADQRVSLWIGGSDGTLVCDNVEKSVGLNGSTIGTFRFRMVGPGYTAWLDNIVVDDDFLPSSNAAPLAVNDTQTLDEGTSVDVDVLANDSDPDSGPQGLSLQSVGTAPNGTATIVAGKVRYSPNPGHFGSDTVSYTISDGLDQATGSIQFTINNTAQAQNLTGFGIGGFDIGASSSGHSRILANGRWEIAGGGAGLMSTADAFHGELKSVTGDFTMVTKIQELQTALGGRVGLIAREGFDASARMLGVSIGLDRVVRHALRATTGGSVTEGSAAGTPWPIPGTWLMLRRLGNTLVAAVSLDDVSYQQIASQEFSQLSPNLRLGLWAGGAPDSTSRGVIEGFEIDQPTVLFTQNFDRVVTGGVLADYISGTPGRGQFSDISAESEGGTWSVVSVNDTGSHYDGKLRLVRPTSVSGSTVNGAGFTRVTQAGTPPQKLAVSFKVAISGVNTWTDIATLDLGAITPWQDYSGVTASPKMANRLTLKGGGNGLFKFVVNSVLSGNYAADGTETQVHWFLNHSADAIGYTGPDLSSQTLGAGKCDLWANGVKLSTFDDLGRPSAFTSNALGAFRFRTTTTQPITLSIENLDMTVLP